MKMLSRSLLACGVVSFATASFAAPSTFDCPPKLDGAVSETVPAPSTEPWKKVPGIGGKASFALEAVTLTINSNTDLKAGGLVTCRYDGLQTMLTAEIPKGCAIQPPSYGFRTANNPAGGATGVTKGPRMDITCKPALLGVTGAGGAAAVCQVTCIGGGK